MSDSRSQSEPTFYQYWRQRTHYILDTAETGDRASFIADFIIIAMIVLNVTAFVLESIPAYAQHYGILFDRFEFFSVIFFTIEYMLRIWACVEHPPLKKLSHWRARFKYALTPYLIIDLIAILPYYLFALFNIDLRILRILRLLRFLKIVRYSSAIQVLIQVFINESQALLGAILIMLSLLLFSSTGMYLIESDVQPDKFGTIPDAMWWSLATLTTVGYGDVAPITPLGKVWGGIFMVFGLGMFAIPIGIVSTGFAQEIQRSEFVISWGMIAKVNIFQELDAHELTEIMPLLHSKRFTKGSLIVRSHDIAQSMYFISTGTVLIESPKISQQLHDGQFFGETALLDRTSYNYSAIAETPCSLLVLDIDDFHYLLRKNAKLNHFFRNIMQARLADDWSFILK